MVVILNPINMIHEILIPSNITEYSNIKFQFEGTAEQAIDEYYRLFNLFRGGAGMSDKEFNEVVDEYIATNKIADGADRYEQMNRDQKMIMQTLKRSFKRTRED